MKLYSTKEASKYLGLKEKTVRDLVMVGVLENVGTHPRAHSYTIQALEDLAIRLGLGKGEVA